MKRISIIIPYYNDPIMVRRCIDSIHVSMMALPDRGDAVEVIVIDDHSPIPFAYPESQIDLHVERLSQNNGVGTARNTGVALSGGEFLLFIDSDVLLHTQHMKQIVDVLNTKPGMNIIQGPTGVEPANKIPGSFQHYLAAAWNYYEKQNWRITVFTQCVLVRKEFFLRMGGFVEKFDRSGGEEFEFALRLGFVKGHHIHYMAGLIHYHHFDTILKRMKKVYFRSRYISGIALGMPNLSTRFKVQAIMRSVYSQLLNLCLILGLIAPLKGLAAYSLIGALFYFSDWRFSRHMLKKKSVWISIVSVFYRQAEYTFINLGMASAFFRKMVTGVAG